LRSSAALRSGSYARRIRTEPGPAGHRQAILAYISLLFGAEKPVVLTPEETLAFPFLPILAAQAALAALVAAVLNTTDRVRATVAEMALVREPVRG
jgi:hypothetical protein